MIAPLMRVISNVTSTSSPGRTGLRKRSGTKESPGAVARKAGPEDTGDGALDQAPWDHDVHDPREAPPGRLQVTVDGIGIAGQGAVGIDLSAGET